MTGDAMRQDPREFRRVRTLDDAQPQVHWDSQPAAACLLVHGTFDHDGAEDGLVRAAARAPTATPFAVDEDLGRVGVRRLHRRLHHLCPDHLEALDDAFFDAQQVHLIRAHRANLVFEQRALRRRRLPLRRRLRPMAINVAGYSDHVRTLQAGTEAALAQAGFDALVLCSGRG